MRMMRIRISDSKTKFAAESDGCSITDILAVEPVM
jgi:hypothetical protein